MDNKKRAALLLVAVLLIAVMCITFTACNGTLEDQIRDLQNKVNGYEENFAEKTVTVYVGESKFDLTTRQAFLHGALKELNGNGSISAYVFSGGDASPFITQIGDLQQDSASGKYYSVWHSLSDGPKSVYSGYMPGRGEQKDEYGTIYVATEYKEITLYYSSVGVGMIPLVDGATYAVLVD